MRILHVIRTLDPAWGGPVQVIRNLVHAGLDSAAENEVVCLDSAEAPWLPPWDIPIHPVGPGSFTFGYSSRLDRWLENNVQRFDAIIIHSIWMYFSFATWKAASAHHVP